MRADSSSSARGNTTLESAVSLTKALRWDIQSLGIRLSKAAGAEEVSRKKDPRSKSNASHKAEIEHIVKDIQDLLARIEDAVPLINLAITTSGARLSTSLPATVSPSRLLQASTFLSAGDTQYSMSPNEGAQVGPTLTLSVYMLFASHTHRANYEGGSGRETTWQEVIHKSRLKLVRVPLRSAYGLNDERSNNARSPTAHSDTGPPDDPKMNFMDGDAKASEFAYQLQIVEDFDDDRVHSFEDEEPQPEFHDGVRRAGIREVLPIFQISKIFYADTGKILNIGGEGETNSPVLLLKRDINALPPRNMMQASENDDEKYESSDTVEASDDEYSRDEEDDSQDDIDQQIRRESSRSIPNDPEPLPHIEAQRIWRFPADLDPEWLALEVYTEEENSESENEEDLNDDSAYATRRPSSFGEPGALEPDLTSKLSNLHLEQASTPTSVGSNSGQIRSPPTFSNSVSTGPLSFPPIRSSLSLLEMLIRLTALQQFQQASHLSIPDEMLTFFLEESSTTGAGGDSETRRRIRNDARRRVGFDPYDESPVKRRGEEYQTKGQYQEQEYDNPGYDQGLYSPRIGTPYSELPQTNTSYIDSARVNSQWLDQSQPRSAPHTASKTRFSGRSSSPGPGTPSPWYMLNLDLPSTPSSPSAMPRHRAPRSASAKPNRPSPFDRLQKQQAGFNAAGKATGAVASPLGRGAYVEDTDSSLGTSPGSPTFVAGRSGRKGSD